jgi:hypothetical protein
MVGRLPFAANVPLSMVKIVLLAVAPARHLYRKDNWPLVGYTYRAVLLPSVSSMQVNYQVGTCAETENKRSSSSCRYLFCFKGVKRVAAKANASAAANHGLPK